MIPQNSTFRRQSNLGNFPWLPCLIFISMLPVIIFRDFTPANELRYVSIASDALRDGNVFTFTNQGSFYADKPPLYLWIVMGAYALCGVDCMWLVALFSLIPGLIICVLMDKMFGNNLTQEKRLTANMMTVTSVLYLSMMFTLRMDMLMTLWIVAATYCMIKIFRSEGNLRTNQWLIGIFVFLALFTKGPFGIIFPLAALVVFLLCMDRIKEFGKYWGWRCWMPIIVFSLSWWGLAFLEGGWEYLDNLLFHQTVDRAVNAFHHKRPFWYYLVNMWWCFSPWSLLIFGVLLERLTSLSNRKPGAPESMSLIMVLIVFVILSIVSGKLAVYLLPCIPYAVYVAVSTTSPEGTLWQRILVGIPACALSLAGTAAVVSICCGMQLFRHVSMFTNIAIACSGLSLACGSIFGMIALFGRNISLYRGVVRIGTSLLLTLFFAGFALPNFNYLIGLRDVSEKAIELQHTYPTEKVVTYKIKRAENIDVFFQRPVQSTMLVSEIEDCLRTGKSLMVISPVAYRSEINSLSGANHISIVKDKDIFFIPQQSIGEETKSPFHKIKDNE